MKDKKEKNSNASAPKTEDAPRPMLTTFSAIDKVVVDNIPSGEEKELNGKKWVQWGEGDSFPNFLYDIYMNCATLHTVCEGIVDYVSGNDVTAKVPQLSDKTARELVRTIARQKLIYGTIALNVLRSYEGSVGSVVPIDIRKIRSDKNNNTFFYSEDFAKKINSWSWSRGKYIESPRFNRSSKQTSSIYWDKGESFGAYGIPLHYAAIIDCEIERRVSVFGLNSIENSFSANYIISLNNGTPTDAVKAEIEEAIYAKYCSPDNAGRPIINFAMGKDHSAEILKLDADNFAERYDSTSKKSRQNIFTCFRANPNLFGIPTENLGFSSEEYESAFKLFNKTVIVPIQTTIKDILADIYGQEAVEIEEFTINFD